MSFVEGIPSHVLSNMAMIQENINSIISSNNRVGGAKISFGSLLDDLNVFSNIDSDFDTFSGVKYTDNPYGKPGSSGNTGIVDSRAFTQNQGMVNNIAETSTEAEASVKNAYESLLNGNASKDFSQIIGSLDKNNTIETINKLRNNKLIDKNTSLITDKEFFNAESLTPFQINEILKKKGSPYAYRTYEDGKSIGQLIYDACHDAGTVEQGNHKLNPALILAIMGAESSFGTDTSLKNKENPFNIKLDDSFHNVNNFETSLKIAVNTMYNWANNRPEGSNVSLLDYAGDKYCEDYTKDWKPNVEKYYVEFTLGNTALNVNSISNAENMQKQLAEKMMNLTSSIGNNLLSSGGGASGNVGGLNIQNLMAMAKQGGNVDPSKIMSSLNLLGSTNVLSNINNVESNTEDYFK